MLKFKGFSALIPIVIGLVVFCLGFWGANELITFVVNQIPQSIHEWFTIIKIVLWIFCFSIVFTISLALGILSGGLSLFIIMLLNNNEDSKE